MYCEHCGKAIASSSSTGAYRCEACGYSGTFGNYVPPVTTMSQVSLQPLTRLCDASSCSKPAVVWHSCTCEDCKDRLHFYTCADHAMPNAVCNGCENVLTSIDLDDSGSNGSDDDLYDDLDEEDEPVTPRTQSASCVSGKVSRDSALAVTLDICGGQQQTILGHNFEAMRKVERSLRPWAGISATAKTVAGPNTAIAEIRMLLTNDDCEMFEFAFRLCDDRERILVFRSTAGSVLVPLGEIARLKALQDSQAISPGEAAVLKELNECAASNLPLVRCFAEDVDSKYGTTTKYAMVGAYSFFKPPDKGSANDAAIAATVYERVHGGGYRDLVEGAKNAEGFHHSEQALFYGLFLCPELLYDAIDVALLQELIPDDALTLEAVSIDVFTTREACGGCMKAAAKVLDDPKHFMSRALAYIASKTAKINVKNVRKFVRFDCDYPFQSGIPVLQKNSAILHGVPGKPIPSAVEPFEILYISLPTNVSPLLLDNGSALTYSPRARSILIALDKLGNTPTSVKLLAQDFQKRLIQVQASGFHEFVFILAWVVKNWCAANVKPGSTLFGEVTDSSMSATAQLVCCRVYYMMDTALAYFKIAKNKPSNPLTEAMLHCVCAVAELGADMLNDETIAALQYAFFKHDARYDPKGYVQAAQDKMKERIDALLKEAEEGEAAADNAARTIAVQYDLLNYYRGKIKKDEDKGKEEEDKEERKDTF